MARLSAKLFVRVIAGFLSGEALLSPAFDGFANVAPASDDQADERAERKAQRAAAKQAERAEHAAEIAVAEAELKKHRAERAAYDKKQARKRAILKSLREQAKQKASE